MTREEFNREMETVLKRRLKELMVELTNVTVSRHCEAVSQGEMEGTAEILAQTIALATLGDRCRDGTHAAHGDRVARMVRELRQLLDQMEAKAIQNIN